MKKESIIAILIILGLVGILIFKDFYCENFQKESGFAFLYSSFAIISLLLFREDKMAILKQILIFIIPLSLIFMYKDYYPNYSLVILVLSLIFYMSSEARSKFLSKNENNAIQKDSKFLTDSPIDNID